MAIYYLGMKTFGRARGKSGSRATSGAAYRAGERIRDERSRAVYDHRRRRDVVHKEIVLPTRLAAAGRALDWARDRATLWNAAESAERQKNARVAREFTVALPHELAPERRATLARQFAQEISDRYGSAVDLTIHAPRGDPRNFHAHLFATTREVTPQGLGPKTTLELSGTERHHRGLSRWSEELASIRDRWAALANETLKEAHIEARITPLSRAEALTRAAAPRLPLAAYHIERRGGHSFIAERIREKHRAARAIVEQIRARTQATWAALRETSHSQTAHPVEARDASGLHGASTPRPSDTAGESARKWAADRRAGRWGPVTSIEETQRESVRNWLAFREAALRKGHDASPEKSAHSSAAARQSGQGMSAEESSEAPERDRSHSHDFDLGL